MDYAVWGGGKAFNQTQNIYEKETESITCNVKTHSRASPVNQPLQQFTPVSSRIKLCFPV